MDRQSCSSHHSSSVPSLPTRQERPSDSALLTDIAFTVNNFALLTINEEPPVGNSLSPIKGECLTRSGRSYDVNKLSESDCTICLTEMLINGKGDEKRVATKCCRMVQYHKGCLEKWFIFYHNKNCPVCKLILVESGLSKKNLRAQVKAIIKKPQNYTTVKGGKSK